MGFTFTGSVTPLLVGLFFACSLSRLPVVSADVDPEPCGLACWLRTLVVHIPDMQFDEKGILVGISNFSCTNFAISHISASLPAPTAMAVDLQGVEVSCGGLWNVSWSIISGKGGVAANATVTDFSMVIDLVKDEKTGLVNHSKVDSCSTKLDLNVTFEGSGPIEKLAEWLFPYIKRSMLTEIERFTCSKLKALVGQNLTEVLQEVNAELVPFMNHAFKPVLPLIPTDAISLVNNSLVRLIDYILNDVVGANGTLGINKIVNNLTDNTGAVHLTPSNLTEFGDYFNISIPSSFVYPLNEFTNLTILFEALNVSGLNTWHNLNFFIPVGENMLNTVTNLTRLDINLTIGINISESSGSIDSRSLFEEVTFVLSMSNNTLEASTVVAVNQTFMRSLLPMQILDPGCSCSGIEVLQTSDIYFDLNLYKFEIVGITGDIEKEFDRFISTLMKLFTSSFSSTIPVFLTAVMGGPVRRETNALIASTIEETKFCSVLNPKSNSTLDEEMTIYVFSVAGALSIVTVFILISIKAGLFESRPKMKKEKRKKKKDKLEHPLPIDENRKLISDDGSISSGMSYSFSGSSSSSAFSLPSVDNLTINMNNSINNSAMAMAYDSNLPSYNSINAIPQDDKYGLPLTPTPGGPEEEKPCLALEDKISPVWRYGIPVVLLLNIALFIVANTSIGASVYVRLTFGEDELWLPSLFDFTLANSVRDMWNAGVYPLSLLIAVFSGAWPYIKLLMMLWVWLVPPSFFSERKRENVIMILDALGKWSLIDCYVMVLMLVSFHTSMVPKESPHSKMDVFVIPGWGFYIFLAATILSLVETHVILAFHRSVGPNGPSPEEEEMLEEKGYLKRRMLSKKAFRGRCADRCNLFGPIFIAVLLLLSLSLAGSGSAIVAFDFKMGGLAGLVLTYLGEAASIPYSLITLGLSIPTSSYNPDFIGIRAIQAIYFVFTLVIPLIHLVALLFLWLTPMWPKAQQRVYKATEIFNAWSALDVFIVSILVALVEINQMAQFIIGDRCDMINVILEKYFAEALHGETTCFQVHTTLDFGCWLLFAAAVGYLVSSTIVMRLSHGSLEAQSDKFDAKIAKWVFKIADGHHNNDEARNRERNARYGPSRMSNESGSGHMEVGEEDEEHNGAEGKEKDDKY